MNQVIKADLYRHFGLHGTRGLIKGLKYPGFRYTFLYRKVTMHSKKSLPGIIYRLLLKRYRIKYGFEINKEAEIERGFYLTSHIGSVVIGQVRIGKNCNIGHLVTIGRGIAGERKGFASIGDNVWIGAGSVIIGNIHIGNNVLIAPNSYVNFNVPDDSVVHGNPARIIKAKNPTADYINYAV
mgnify:FL=1